MTDAIGFKYEDKLQEARSSLDVNNDAQVSVEEARDEKKREQAIPALMGLVLPGGIKPLSLAKNETNYVPVAEDLAKGLNSGIGVTNNRNLFPGATTPAGARYEMNMSDASNHQRMRAAGLSTEQINDKNIYVHLGKDSEGNARIGFYSKGFGEGDERAGVITLKPGTKIDNLGADGWSQASKEDLGTMKAAYDARTELIKKDYQGDFAKYKEAEEIRAKVGDLLSHSATTDTQRNALKAIKTKEDFDKFIKEDANKPLAKSLVEIRLAEAEGRVDAKELNALKDSLAKPDANLADIEKTLDEKLNATSSTKHSLDEAKKKDLEAAKKKLDDSLKGIDLTKLDSATRAKVEVFKSVQDTISKQTDGTQKLAELNWQNHRFEQLMKDNGFKSAVEKSKEEERNPSELNPVKPVPKEPTITPTEVDFSSRKDATKIAETTQRGDATVIRAGGKQFVSSTGVFTPLDAKDGNDRHIVVGDYLVKIGALDSFNTRNQNTIIARTSDGEISFSRTDKGFQVMAKVSEGPLTGALVHQNGDNKSYLHYYKEENGYAEAKLTEAGRAIIGDANIPNIQLISFELNDRKFYMRNVDAAAGGFALMEDSGVYGIEADTLAKAGDKLDPEVEKYEELHGEMARLQWTTNPPKDLGLTTIFDAITEGGKFNIAKLNELEAAIAKAKQK